LVGEGELGREAAELAKLLMLGPRGRSWLSRPGSGFRQPRLPAGSIFAVAPFDT
jgi:hypothetical protein